MYKPTPGYESAVCSLSILRSSPAHKRARKQTVFQGPSFIESIAYCLLLHAKFLGPLADCFRFSIERDGLTFTLVDSIP